MSDYLRIQTKSGTYTVVPNDNSTVLDCSGTFSLNLTTAGTLRSGFNFWVWNSGSGTITIDPAGSETVDGSATKDIAAGVRCRVVCDGMIFKTDSYTQSSNSVPSTTASIKYLYGGF